MAEWQPEYHFAWCLHIQSATPIYAATVDLPEDAAVTTLGAFYHRRIKSSDITITRQLANFFYGVSIPDAITVTLNNADLAIDPTDEWRMVPVILYHYDRRLNTKTTEFTGLIGAVAPLNSTVTFTIIAYNAALLNEFLPLGVIDPQIDSPFETSQRASAPLPVIFGVDVPVRPPHVATPDSDPTGYDYAVSYGTAYITGAFLDADTDVAGLERLGEWEVAPGSPIYVDATHFSVAGTANVDQSQRYAAGTPIRFKTTASGAEFLYSAVKVYNEVATPDTVEIEDALFDSGLNAVQLGGDWVVLRGAAYQDITAGILPEPDAPGADLTVIRLFAPEDNNLIVTATNPAYATGAINAVIGAILTNAIWGLSHYSAQTIDTDSFNAASVALGLAGLDGAINGALGYDQQQRRAGDVLDELCSLRGIRLSIDASANWHITVDTQPAVAMSFVLGPGDEIGPRIKRVEAHTFAPVDQAIRNVILHWQPLGRSDDNNQKFTPREYARLSICAVTGIGQDRHYYSQWIRTPDIAAAVVYYLAQKLKGLDETCTIVCGVEARDLEPGDAITIQVPSDGIAGDWQISGVTKTLTEVTLSCFRLNLDAYGTPTGVTHSEAPSDIDPRTSPGVGSNVLPNPDFSPPTDTEGFPHGWQILIDDSLGVVGVEVDYSLAALPYVIGGHYVRFTSTATIPRVSMATHNCLLAQNIPIRVETVRDVIMFSVYCDQSDGVFFIVTEWPANQSKFVPVTYDATDTNGLGWGRYYGRTNLSISTERIDWHIAVHRDATWQFDAADVRNVGRSARRPPVWARHRPQPITLAESAEVTLSGAGPFVATSLIKAGSYVQGITSRITEAIVFGTATTYDIGTANSPDAWGSGLTATALDSTTNPIHFNARTATYYPTATSVQVSVPSGTITSGKMRLAVIYTTVPLASGN